MRQRRQLGLVGCEEPLVGVGMALIAVGRCVPERARRGRVGLPVAIVAGGGQVGAHQGQSGARMVFDRVGMGREVALLVAADARRSGELAGVGILMAGGTVVGQPTWIAGSERRLDG
jgi:hypothetical protein